MRKRLEQVIKTERRGFAQRNCFRNPFYEEDETEGELSENNEGALRLSGA